MRDQRALFALRGNLLLHRGKHLLRRGDVLDLIAQHFHTPVRAGFVQREYHGAVDRIAVFQQFIQVALAAFRAQRGLRQHGDGGEIIRGAIAGACGVGDLVIQHAIHLHLGVVARDTDLRRDVDGKLGETVAIGDAIHERDDDVQAGLQCPVVFAEPLDHPGILLRHDLDRLICQNDSE